MYTSTCRQLTKTTRHWWGQKWSKIADVPKCWADISWHVADMSSDTTMSRQNWWLQHPTNPTKLYPVSKEHVYRVGFYTIPYIWAYIWSWHTWPAAKEATYYMGVDVQSNRWTGSILRSSSYDLIDWHWFLRRYLVVFKISFSNEVVTPGVTVT